MEEGSILSMATIEEELPNATSIPKEASERARRRATYSSFGEDGLTATANAYGHLLQITQYFGNKPSGFVSVDLPTTTVPYFVSRRAHDLHRQSIDPTKGIRLLFEKTDSNTLNTDIWETDPPTLRSMSTPEFLNPPTPRPDEVTAPLPALQQESRPAPTVKFLHNRWPCFLTKTPGFEINIRYYISDKTVYQNYLFTLRKGSQVPSKIPKMVIDANFPLRDLDFVHQKEMNVYHTNNPNTNYACRVTKDGYCVARINTACGVDNYDRGSIALFISSFINGQRQKPLPSEEPNSFFVVPDRNALDHLRENKTIEFTLAYTLRWIVPSEIERAPSTVSEAALEKWKEKISVHPSQSVLIALNKHLDFALKRNLEHVLSVCSIPINEGGGDRRIPAIALTCGDMSGHRVTAATSFYAFQLLLSAFQFFESLSKQECECIAADCACKKYSNEMRKRILRVCWGHLKWIFNEANEDDSSSLQSWASGEGIDNWASGQSQSRKSLIDASFNIAKVADFCIKAATRKQKESVMDELRGLVSDWVENLHRNNHNNEYVFPHCKEHTPQIFQLSDHAMIWRTLRSLEDLGFTSELCTSDIRRGRHNIRYSSSRIQKSIFKHFTTKSAQLDKSMIATSRSLSETSFLLKIQDTATLYAMNEGLFDGLNEREELEDNPTTILTNDPLDQSVEMFVGESPYQFNYGSMDFWENKIDPWKATIDSQVLHDDNDDATWDHPLQFALAMILSANGKCSNSRPASKMYKFARSALLQSSSPNGLFPGQFDENREPILFSEDVRRDYYWHATFEIPHILWSYNGDVTGRSERSATQNSSTSSFTAEMSYGSGYMQRIEPVLHSKELKSDSMASYEWLYKTPKFFRFHIDLSNDAIKRFCKKRESSNNGKSSGTIDRAVEEHRNPNLRSSHPQDLGYIIDVSGVDNSKFLSQRSLTHNVFSPEDIRRFIGGPRDSANAKKRLFHFYRANLDIALNCYLASSEQEEISAFFDKHSSYSKYFFEDTTTIFNKWVTELHLSFYQVVSNHASFPSIPLRETFEFPSSTKDKNDKRAARAVMSFRFDGDLFDHYWTCHFFNYNPQWMSNSRAGGQCIYKIPISGTPEKDPWQQRRILELLLFDMILQEMVRGTKGILKEIMTSVLKSPQLDDEGGTDLLSTEFTDIDASVLLEALEVLSKVDSSTFASKNELWNKFQRILQVIEVDLTENLTMIDLWLNRENQAEINKLGWTPRREQRYQGAISKLKLLNSHKIHELKRCRTNVASFNTLLTRRLEVMRNDLETRSNVDIRLFTYVTVVFLPISFATSVFSMSGPPTRETMCDMASTAGVALVITIVALINAKVLDAEIFRPIFQSIRPLSEVTLRPVLRNCRYAFRFFTGLMYIILLTLLSTLSGKHIHFLYQHLFSPLYLLVERGLSGEGDKQACESGGFFDKGIENKMKQIMEKREEGAKCMKDKRGEVLEKEEEENRSEMEERYDESKRRAKMIYEVSKKLPQVEEALLREESGTDTLSEGMFVLDNEDVGGRNSTNIIQKVKRWFKMGGSKVDRMNV